MFKRQIEKKLAQAFRNETPDILREIKQELPELKEKEKRSTPHFFLPRLLPAALVLILLLNIFHFQHNAVYASVLFDVNPTFNLELKDAKTIKDLIALDEKAEKILAGEKFKDCDLQEGLEKIFDALYQAGYLNEAHNSLLLTFIGQKGQEVSNTVSYTLQRQSQTKGFTLALIKQYSADKELNEARKLLTAKIAEANPRLTLAALADLNINDLHLLLSDAILPEKTVIEGKATEEAYIGKEKALLTALKEYGFKKEEVQAIEIEYEAEDGRMIYEVEFRKGNYTYEVELLAADGKIIAKEKERIEKEEHSDDEQILKLICAQFKCRKEEIKELTIEFEDEESVYEAEFSYHSQTYRLIIDADKQRILKKEASPQETGKFITQQKAVEIAAKAFKLEVKALKDLEVELEKDEHIYKIEFKAEKAEYEVIIDALSGKILKSEKEDD